MLRAGAVSVSKTSLPHDARRVCLARILRAHGVQGAVWVESFTLPPLALKAYAPLQTQGGRALSFAHLQAVRGARLRARFPGVESRAAADELAGEFLFAPREKLPRQDADTWYHADLLGLTAESADGATLGEIVGVHEFGAGPLLEVRPPEGESFFLPFRREHVAKIDLAEKRLVVEHWEGFV